MKEDGRMSKTIIFLGAGASKAEGAPLQAELFSSYVEAINSQPYKDNKRFKSTKHNVEEFFKTFFGIDIESLPEGDSTINDLFPTFEEALGVLDLAISKNELYRAQGYKLNSYRTSLVFAMAIAIQFKLDVERSGGYATHFNLISSLREQLVKKNIVLISTNYDLLADNAIIDNTAYCDYGFGYKNPSYDHSIRILKVHGSLNWLYCPVCKQIKVGKKEKTMISAELNQIGKQCTYCKSTLCSIVVPPTYYKDMSNPYLQKVYEEAERELLDAKEIIFCGYSFPDADMHIKYMLKRAEMNSMRKHPLKIKVINKSKSEEEKNRYLRFFKDKAEVDYRDGVSFEDFSKRPHLFID